MDHKYRKLINFVENIKELNHSSAAALMIIHNDQVVLEHYNGTHSNMLDSRAVSEDSQFNVASARKSYLGLAVAYAFYEGKINSLDDLVSDYFDEIDKDILGRTTIRHIVTHTHGLNQREDGTIYREFPAGEGWAYQKININMMTELVHRLYNKSFPELLKERVFQPLGFTETAWQTKEHEKLVKVIIDPMGKPHSNIGLKSDGLETNLFVSTREFATWGFLHLKKGFLNGKQIVPKKVIDLATQIHSPTFADIPQNGLFWYIQGEPAAKSELGERVPKGSYQILGVTGPTLLVIPAYNVVVVKMYNKRYNYEGLEGENYLYYLREFSNLVADTFATKWNADETLRVRKSSKG